MDFRNSQTNSKGISRKIVTLVALVLNLAALELASRAGTQVIAWGENFSHQTDLPPGLTNIIQVSAYGYNGSALRATGIPVQWGMITNDPTHNVPTNLTNAVLIAAGADPYNLALTSDRRIVGWGGNDYGCSTVPAGTNRYVALAAGYIHSLAVTTEGKVLAWGDNSDGQTNVPSWLSNVVAVAAGEFHSLALRNDGTVVGWGGNIYGESTGTPTSYSTNGVVSLKGQILDNVVAIAAGIARFSVALKRDGTVVAWGENSGGSTTVPAGLSNVVAVAAGTYYALALKSDGILVAWGLSIYGAANVPAGLSNVISIAAGSDHVLALVSDEFPIFYGPLQNPFKAQNNFSVTVPSLGGKVYALEFKNSLSPGPWAALPLVAGTGRPLVLTDPAATNSSRIYRVRRW